MGIHDRSNPCAKIVQINELNTGNAVIHDSYSSDDASSVASERPAPPPRRTRNSKAQAIDFQSFTNRLNCKSRRLAKRHNQLSFVRTLVGLEESEIENELTWTPESYGQSAFTSLFQEAENMKVWNKFVQLTEEEQASVIEGSQVNLPKSDTDGQEDNNEGFVLPDVSTADKRNVHPSYSSEECFKLINQNIRSLLIKRHVPLGLIECLELNMRQCFDDCPYSVFEPDIQTSFGRLFAHAVTQYLGLEAISYSEDKVRKMTVVNKYQTFNPPAQLLTEYLEWKAGKH